MVRPHRLPIVLGSTMRFPTLGAKMTGRTAVRQLVWDSMLNADLNCRYFRALSGRLRSWDQAGKIFVAAMSSAAVAGWAIWDESGFQTAWHAAGGLAAVVAVALPILNPSKAAAAASQLTGAWFSLLRDYEMLWTRVDAADEAELREAAERIVSAEKPLSDIESALSMHRGLAKRCEDEVRRSRGLA